MIKEKDLQSILDFSNDFGIAAKSRYTYKNAGGATYKTLENALSECAKECGVPVAFYMDEVSHGFIQKSQCMVMYNPEHEKDYFKFALELKNQGNMAIIGVSYFGTSAQSAHISVNKTLKSKTDMATKLGHLVGAGIFKATHGRMDSNAYEDEYSYYTIVLEFFEQLNLSH